MNKTELFIYYENGWRKLDLGENISFPITYNIADVKDISKRNGSFTKTLVIPHTTNNSQLLDFIFDVQNLSSFNPNKKVRCYVLNDTIEVFEGFFQLKNITTSDNIHFKYECVIFGDNNTLIKSIGDDYIEDLDFSDIEHTVNYTNIVDSWSDDWTRGYYYPLIDYNHNWGLNDLQNDGVDISEMKAAVYVKYIWERIISENGFTYYGSFKDNETFENLIIPDGFDLVGRSDVNSALNRLYVGISSTYSIAPASTNNGNYGNLSIPFENVGFDPRVPLNNESSPFGDPAGEWDSTNYEYIAPNNDLVRRFGVKLRIKVFNDYQNILTGFKTAGGYLTMRFVREFDPVTGTPYSVFQSSGLAASLPAGTRYGYPLPVENAPTTYFNELFFPGHFHILTTPNGNSNLLSEPFNGIIGSFRNTYNISPIFNSDNVVSEVPGPGGYKIYEGNITTSYLDRDLYNTDQPEYNKLYPGEKVWLEVDSFYIRPTVNSMYNNNIVPFVVEEATITTDISISEKKHKAKQVDFVNSIIKMFNLFIEPDKNDPKRLLIETRDDYYERGTVKDWSRKLDISKPISQKIIAETGPRRWIFTHKKEDKDFLNKIYNNETDEVYGEKDYLIENDFNEGTKKIETIFSPSLSLKLGENTNFVIPQYRSVDDDSEPNKVYGGIRILQRATQSISLNNSYWKLNGVTQTTYPYAGHFNHPLNATTDINFGEPKFIYYEGNYITNNNLFNVYYRKMIEELTDKDSRIITANFYLTPRDLNELRFYDKIFIDSMASGTGNYFRINKIEYNPISSGSYKVELLKIKDIDLNIIKQKVGNDLINTTGWGITKPVRYPFPGKGVNTLVLGEGNVGNTNNDIFILGNENKTGNNVSGFIYGENNTIEAESFLSAIMGGNNNYIVNADNSVILGGENNEIGAFSKNNTIIGGYENKIESNIENSVIIGGRKNTVRENNRVYISNPMIKVSNFVSGGRDEVLNHFPENKVDNFISGGRDEIRPLGSHSIENLISGGYDFII